MLESFHFVVLGIFLFAYTVTNRLSFPSFGYTSLVCITSLVLVVLRLPPSFQKLRIVEIETEIEKMNLPLVSCLLFRLIAFIRSASHDQQNNDNGNNNDNNNNIPPSLPLVCFSSSYNTLLSSCFPTIGYCSCQFISMMHAYIRACFFFLLLHCYRWRRRRRRWEWSGHSGISNRWRWRRGRWWHSSCHPTARFRFRWVRLVQDVK